LLVLSLRPTSPSTQLAWELLRTVFVEPPGGESTGAACGEGLMMALMSMGGTVGAPTAHSKHPVETSVELQGPY
jgi:hypothetical protein